VLRVRVVKLLGAADDVGRGNQWEEAMNNSKTEACEGRGSRATTIDTNVLFTAIEASGTGIVISDCGLPDNPLIYVNDGFCQISGYSRDEVVGRNCRFLQGKFTDQAAVARLREAIAKRQSISVRLVNHRKDGTIFHNELHMSPVLDASGNATHFVGVQHDVSAQVAAEEQVRELTARLTSANEQLQAFADTTGRELLAALRPILMYAKELEAQATGRDAEALGIIHASAARAREFVTQMLEYSSVQSTKLECTTVKWESMLEAICRGVRGVTLHREGLERGPSGDETLLKHAIGALVGNAAKFVKHGTHPQVDVRAFTVGEEFVLEVADRGIGIDGERAKKLSEPFVRMHASSKYPGFGLGLALASRVAERHGGRVELSPREGGGTVARLYLARAVGELQRRKNAA
jgi:PAS domain S-box-containing protein